LGIAYKRARYFITCNGSYGGSGIDFSREHLHSVLAAPIEGGRHGRRADKTLPGQLKLFEDVAPTTEALLANARPAQLPPATAAPSQAPSASSPALAQQGQPSARQIVPWF